MKKVTVKLVFEIPETEIDTSEFQEFKQYIESGEMANEYAETNLDIQNVQANISIE